VFVKSSKSLGLTKYFGKSSSSSPGSSCAKTRKASEPVSYLKSTFYSCSTPTVETALTSDVPSVPSITFVVLEGSPKS
jgi:hypothetical protein